MPIYAGSFRNYRECGTFWYMTHLVVRGEGGGGPGSQFFSLESHPTIRCVVCDNVWMHSHVIVLLDIDNRIQKSKCKV